MPANLAPKEDFSFSKVMSWFGTNGLSSFIEDIRWVNTRKSILGYFGFPYRQFTCPQKQVKGGSDICITLTTNHTDASTSKGAQNRGGLWWLITSTDSWQRDCGLSHSHPPALQIFQSVKDEFMYSKGIQTKLSTRVAPSKQAGGNETSPERTTLARLALWLLVEKAIIRSFCLHTGWHSTDQGFIFTSKSAPPFIIPWRLSQRKLNSCRHKLYITENTSWKKKQKQF